MKWILYFLLFSIAIASLGFWYLQDPGCIKIIWLGFEVQFSLIVGFLILLFAFFLMALLKFCLSWFLRIPCRWVSFFQQAQNKKAKHEFLDLYSSFEAENFTDALYHQKKAAPHFLADPLFLWISGNTFEKADQHLDAEKYFMTLTKNPLTTFLGLKGQIRAALHRGDSKLAYILLEQAEKLMPTSPWVLKHLLALTRDQKNFKEAARLILHLEDLGYFSSDTSKKQIASLLYHEAMRPETSASQKEELLRQSHGLNPGLIETTERLAQLLFDQENKHDALYILETTWVLAPTQPLGDLYLKIVGPKNELEAYQLATQFVKNNPKSKDSLLLLARYALKAKLWGETHSLLADLLKQDSSSDVYHLLAILELEETQNSKAAIAWLKKGLHAPRSQAPFPFTQ